MKFCLNTYITLSIITVSALLTGCSRDDRSGYNQAVVDTFNDYYGNEKGLNFLDTKRNPYVDIIACKRETANQTDFFRISIPESDIEEIRYLPLSTFNKDYVFEVENAYFFEINVNFPGDDGYSVSSRVQGHGFLEIRKLMSFLGSPEKFTFEIFNGSEELLSIQKDAAAFDNDETVKTYVLRPPTINSSGRSLEPLECWQSLNL